MTPALSMSISDVHPEPEQILLTPLFSRSQALLLPTHETDTETLAPASDQSHTGQQDQNDPNGEKHTNSAFVIRQASTIYDPDELLEAQEEDAAYIQWNLEILVLLFAGAVFMSICLILGSYHEEVLPDWEDLRITLNTLISVLATILRVAIAFVVFEIIAQLKWEWLTTCFRPAYHAQLFSAASRGVYGCFRLLPTIVRHEPFTIASIAIAVLSLSIGSFTQQSIQTYPCWKTASIVGESAFIRIANTVSKDDMTDSSEQYEESVSHSHASLGVCNKCHDIYSLIETRRINQDVPRTTFELPFEIHTQWKGHGSRGRATITGKNEQGWRVMTTTTLEDFDWARDAVTSEFLRLAQISVANFTILTTSLSNCTRSEGNLSCPHDCKERRESTSEDEKCIPRGEDSYDPVAAACTLYPCLKYYTANVTMAQLEETVVREVPLQLHGHGSLQESFYQLMDGGNVSFGAIQQPCPADGLWYTNDDISLRSDLDQDGSTDMPGFLNTTAPLECLFDMPQPIWIGLWNELQFSLNSNCFTMDDGGVQCKVSREKDEAGHPDNAIPSYPAHLAALYYNNKASIRTINDTLNALAERLTTAIRLDGRRIGKDEKSKVKGKLLETKVCVNFVWQWLVFPGALLVSSTVLLGAIVIKDTLAKKASIWKSSILPLLLKGHVGTQNRSLKSLEEISEGLEVKLQREKTQQDFE
ncbi:hypothetical protein NW766_005864 [Fusarium irregulare]|uniref:Uncharacterized protein n=1 Tax=Fusarium irregulare TaxID=2494466 RepID=A0A9W8PSW1_9HYPO|nr:hypothetical protein NW766_005864 [Fusarium irregulare]